jgi:four helix bundle protein
MQNAEVKTTEIGVRTRAFALRIIMLFKALPKTTEAQIIGKQLLRSGTSVGAQYHEGKRARSKAEFRSKIESALQELEETGYWLELLVESGIVTKKKLEKLMLEQNELASIFVTSINTAKAR